MEEKLLRKLAGVAEEGKCVQNILRKLKYEVEELMRICWKPSMRSARSWEVLHMQLTMLRFAVSSCLELFGDNMVEVEVDKEVKVNLSDSTSETTGQKVVLSLDHFVQVKNDSERL